MIETTDNNCGNYQIDDLHIDDLIKISDVKIKDIKNSNDQDILLFGSSLTHTQKLISEQSIFSVQDKSLVTNNMMGFIGINNTEVKIKSRFSKADQDYFLHYMLQKVLAINLVELNHSSTNESIFDFLIYLFPYFLKKALKQGLYKEYQQRHYNDLNFRGSVNIDTHIKTNIPFQGKIAYKVKEHSYDNHITQLIRHTIEHIKNIQLGVNVLNIDSETKHYVNQILHSTPTFQKRNRSVVLHQNIRPFSHPYYTSYRELQKICIQILKYQGLKYGKDKDKVYGILFDGAWLWEEYLNTLLSDLNFIHSCNTNKTSPIFLFTTCKSARYPDFWKENFVLDAKYKRLSRLNNKQIEREDFHQIITYMYILKASKSGFICPTDNIYTKLFVPIGVLNGYGGSTYLWSLYIPQNPISYLDFCNQIQKEEQKFLQSINSI